MSNVFLHEIFVGKRSVMKRNWTVFALVALIIALHPVSVSAADGKLNHDPNGFKKYSWDMKVKEFNGLVLWGESDDPLGSKTYHLPDEPLTFGDVTVEKILYSFYGDHFKRVTIKYREADSFHALLRTLEAQFGTGRGDLRFSLDKEWVGPHTHMMLTYDDQMSIGALVISQLQYKAG